MTPAEKLSKQKLRDPKHRSRRVRDAVFNCSVRERRIALKLTIRDVSEQTGLTPACISVVEHGSSVELRTAFKLAAFFGCTVEELWTPAAACLAKIRGGR